MLIYTWTHYPDSKPTNHDLPHSRRACQPLHHQCSSMIVYINYVLNRYMSQEHTGSLRLYANYNGSLRLYANYNGSLRLYAKRINI
jgi:hypothetical protein